MFRDSHGVVHTVSAVDPLQDLPDAAILALQEALLRPVQGDLASALERCDAVRELVERWQDAFFAALPDAHDPVEEAHWAAEAGVALGDIEDSYDDDEADDAEDDEGAGDPDSGGGVMDLDLITSAGRPDDPRAVLPEELVSVLERELLLLPLRVRLEALVAAAELVDGWADLLADHEKLIGHLFLAHADRGVAAREATAEAAAGTAAAAAVDLSALSHEQLSDRHADAHAVSGPSHHPVLDQDPPTSGPDPAHLPGEL